MNKRESKKILTHCSFFPKNRKAKIHKFILVSFAFLSALLFLIFLIQGTITISQTDSTNTNATREGNNLTHLNVSNSSIVLYMPFDENYNSTFTFDYTNNSNDGTLVGNTIYNTSQAIYGGFYTFDGTGDYIKIPPISIPENITVSAWVYSSNFDQNGFVVAKKPVNAQWQLFFQTAGTPGLKWATDGTYVCITSLPSNNQWHHIVAIQNGTTCKIYVDGALVETDTTTAISNGMTSGTNDILISTYDGSAYPFNGNIDEVMIWNIALNSTEVLAIYNNQTARFHGTGEMLFQNLNFGGNNTINISLQNCQTNMGSSLRGKINNGNWANFSSCNITDYSATGNLTNANLTVGFIGGNGTIANTFYTPLVIGNITLDSKPTFPTITINIPTNNSFTTDTSQDVNFTVQDSNLNTCWYSNDTYTANTTLTNCNTNITTITWSEGQHNVTVYVNNSANKVNSSMVTFTIDTIKPTFAWENPTPTDKSSSTSNSTYLNVTITDASQTSAWFDWNKSLVGYWPMDFRNSTGVYDNSTNENFGTAVGGAVFNSSGFYGGAYTFDGVNDYIQIGSGKVFNTNLGSVSVWIKINTLGDSKRYLAFGGDGDSNFQGFETRLVGADTVFAVTNIGTGASDVVYGNTAISAGQWYHVVTISDGTTYTIYVNNVAQTLNALAGTNSGDWWAEAGSPANGIITLGAGKYSGAIQFNISANIDELMVFDRALSTTEISALYNNTANRLQNNFTSLSEGTYNYSAYSIDKAGNLNITSPDRQITYNLDGTAPNISSILYSPNSTDNVDPSTNITFSANVSDALNQVSFVTLQYYNGTTWANSTMSNNTLTNYTTSIITVSSQQNYTFNIWANDSLGNGNHSTNQTFNSTWDCTWLSTPDIGQTSGWDTNKFVGNISVNNTGDSSHSTGCSLDFRLTYDLPEGRIYFDNSYLKPSNTYTIAAKANRTIEVNASFLSEIKEEAVIITTQEMFSRSNTSKLNTTLTILSSQSGPYLFQKITSSPNEVSLTAGNFSLEGYIRNLMGGTTVNATNTAYNATFNWTLPSGFTNVSGTYKTNFTNITDSDLHYNNINASFSSLASMTSGVKTFYLYATGVNISGNAIKDSNNNTILKKEVNITFSCYATSDSVCVTACGSANDPDCVASTTTTTSSSGGGGGGSAGPLTITGKSSAEYELVRGREQSFELEIQNQYSGTLENLKISVSGIDKGLIEIFPSEINRIEAGASKFLTVKIIAPSYFTEGSYTLDFSISGSLVSLDKTTKPYIGRKRVDLFIIDLPREEANKMKSDSLEMIEQMNNTNMSLKEVLIFYSSLEKSFEEVKFSLVKQNYESIKEVYDNAFGSLELIEELYKRIKDAERRGISVLETKKLLFIGEAVFKRGDYSSSIKRLKEAQLTFALETKGEFNLFYAVKNNPLESSGILLGAIVITFSSFLSVKYRLYKRKLRMLAEEEKLLLELMKVVQRETFEKNHLSMEEYGQAMSQYETKLSSVIEDKIKTETKLTHLFKIKGKQKALKQEKEKLYNLVKNLQDDYLNKRKIETRVYENMIKIYSARIIEIDEQLIFIEAKEALRGRLKPIK